ncbi:MAG: aminoglycoside phosphotransferase family protein [Deltaproteobacteria bacterium]|nr:aminoglycoside phosphotransferase family protein [Deltaproteobacteria bacterium]
MPLVTDLPIPSTAEEISAEWLSEVLGLRFPRAIASSVEVIDAHSGTTGRARLRVEWKGNSRAPSAIFAKLAPTDPIQKEMVISTGMGKREAHFFDGLAEEIPVRVPAPLWSGWNATGDAYIMLIEDLAEAGCSFPSSRGDTDRHPERMIDALASLHGHYWESPRFGAGEDLAWITRPMRGEMGPLLIGSALEQFGPKMPAPFRDLADLYIHHTDAMNELLDTGPKTLIHGDSHMGNTFVDGDRVGLHDWACTAHAPGIRDFSYYVCNSIPTRRRQRDERVLLRRYLEGLAESGGPRLDEAATHDLHRRYAVCSWIAATATAAAGSRMQSIEVGMRAMKRATTAICDLETSALLRAELGV